MTGYEIEKEHALKIIKAMRTDWDEDSKTPNAHALDMAINALEKQIPKEVSIMKYRNDYDWTCNNCDTTFKYIRYIVDKPMYCPNCGQAIKWE